MDKIIRIAALHNPAAQQRAEHGRAQLAAIGCAAEIVILASSAAGALESSLLWGEADMALFPLEELPVTLPEGLVITAVSERSNPAEWLLVRHASVEDGRLFGLAEHALVSAQGTRRQAQLLDFRPDLHIADASGNPESVLNQLLAGAFDAALLPAAALGDVLPDLHVVRFNPKELMPAPGQGVWAYLCGKEDFSLRRILKGLHHPEVSAVTNIERGIFRLLGGDPDLPFGAYAEYDGQGNHHVWAAAAIDGAPLRRVRLSSSTTFQLAERVAEQLKG